jgi:hypothetical protein
VPAEAQSKHGRVFKEKADHPLSAYWRDPENGVRLWSITEDLLQGARPDPETAFA